ncbi:hypothetical protein QUB68_28955 [Microcoleus sp. A006_D1]|uniref:hypothetical protein n=1 Tax=Microcoleus sp. A006_D1 TaxID=3055267 RepID=UPI002FD6E924
MLLAVSLASVIVVSGIGWYQTQATLRTKIADQLVGIRTSKTDQTELFFENLYNQVGMLAGDSNVIKAMVELNAGFRNLERNFVPSQSEKGLETYYTKQFLPRLKKNLFSEDPSFGKYRPTGQAARYLQYYYMADNPNPVGEKNKLFDAGDRSEYTKAHAKYHIFFQDIVEKFGYYDVFLINHKTADVVYSYFK